MSEFLMGPLGSLKVYSKSKIPFRKTKIPCRKFPSKKGRPPGKTYEKINIGQNSDPLYTG